MDYEAIAMWATGRHVGASSQCMARHLMGADSDGSYPRDGGDFDRCEALLDAAPDLRARITEMATVNEYWAALVPRWNEIRDANQDQKYGLIQSILRPAEDAAPNLVRLGKGLTMRFGKP